MPPKPATIERLKSKVKAVADAKGESDAKKVQNIIEAKAKKAQDKIDKKAKKVQDDANLKSKKVQDKVESDASAIALAKENQKLLNLKLLLPQEY